MPTDSPRRCDARDRSLASEQDLVAAVNAARTGDTKAWTRLVQRFDGTLRCVARSYRLAPPDVDDVIQATWVELLASIQRIREPAAIGAWLTTVTRRNALRCRQRHVYECLTEDPDVGERHDANGPEERVLADERRAALADAIAILPTHHRSLVTVLLAQPSLDYRQVGQLLSMPVGSIGPTRARALAGLGRNARLRAISA